MSRYILSYMDYSVYYILLQLVQRAVLDCGVPKRTPLQEKGCCITATTPVNGRQCVGTTGTVWMLRSPAEIWVSMEA